MLRAARNSDGFSLVEVLAALFILGVAAVTVMGMFSTSLRNVQKSERHALATIHARSLLEEAVAIGDVAAIRGEVDLGGGMMGMREVEVEGHGEELAIYDIRVTVSWPPSGRVTLGRKMTKVELER